MNQKTLNDIANQEFANMKKVVDQTPKSLEKLFDMMKEPVEILESEVDYSNVTDSKEFLIDLVLPQEEIEQQLKNGTITIAQAQHFTKILKETLINPITEEKSEIYILNENNKATQITINKDLNKIRNIAISNGENYKIFNRSYFYAIYQKDLYMFLVGLLCLAIPPL